MEGSASRRDGVPNVGAMRADDSAHATSPPEGDRWLRSVIENSSEIVIIVDPYGTLTYASPAFERMLGYDPDEAVGTMNVHDYVHPDDLPLVLEEVERAFSARGVATNKGEHRFRHRDGSWRWVESTGAYLLDDPVVRGVVVHTRDVTERKEAAVRLAESERRFSSVVSNAHAFVYRRSNEPGYPHDYASDLALELTGYPPERLLAGGGIRYQDIIVEEDKGRVREETQEALVERNSFELRYAIRRRDGRISYVRDSGQGVYDEDGEVIALEGVIYDVTKLVEIEEALKESEERYRALVERVPAVIYIQRPREGESAAYDTTYMSPQVENLLGYPADSFVEAPGFWDSLIHPEDLEGVLAEDDRTDRTGEPFAMEYRMVTTDGRLVWVRDEATLVRDDAGEPLYWLGVQMDITDRKNSEDALRDAEERFRTLVEQIPAVTYIDRADGSDVSLYTSPQIEEMLGYTSEEWVGRRLWPERLHPDDKERVLAADERFEAGAEERFSEEYRLLAKDGSVVWVREEAVVLEDEAGNPKFWQGVILDVTERKEAEERLAESEQRFRSAFEDAGIGMALSSPDGRYLRVNRAFCGMVGYAEGELLGMTFRDITHPDDLREVLGLGRGVLAGEDRSFSMEKRYVRKDGSEIWVHLTVSMLRGPSGEPLYSIAQAQDITGRKRTEKRLERHALHDALTGLPNRKRLLDRLRHALERTRRREGRKVAVLFMDLDGFKVINDSLGHEAGDLLLTVVGQRLRRSLRPEDALARFGGDEFVVLIEDVDAPEDAVRVAERITEELGRPFALEGRSLFASASIGIGIGNARTKSPEDLLRDADTAMYRAKEDNAPYMVFDPAMHKRVKNRLDIENDLRRAVGAKEFVLYYQPMVDLRTDEVWGVEALVRWEHPERGLLVPSEFVPVAEESGLVIALGDHVLVEACRQAMGWQDDPRIPPLVVSVNLSALQVSRPDLAVTVENALRETGFDARRLSLDVTETAYIQALDAESAVLDRLKALGVGLSIDDFGTGYSSLSYLKRLPASVLKIDRTFLAGLGEEAEDTAIVRMVIDLAHTLGMKVIAEGVEGWGQAALLREMGCDLAQGFYFSEPLPPDVVTRWLVG